MIRLLVPLAIVSLGLAAEQEQSQDVGAFIQAPLASVEQPQQQFYYSQQLQSFPGDAQQYVQYQPQTQQQAFYYPQQQSVYYPYQPFQQLQFAPVQQPAFVMSPKLTIPTGLLRKHGNSSSEEPSVFAFSYNTETGLKVATINGKKVFAYKQGFPGSPKEDVEIVENGDVKTSGNPTVVSSTSENGNGEKTKNVWFDDKDDPMVKIEKEPVGAVATTTVDPNLPVVSQDGDETTTAAPAATTTAEATTTADVEVAAGGVTVTTVPAAAAAADATTTVAAMPAATVVATVATTTAAPVTTTTTVTGEAFFAAQNPLYMANVAAFSAQYPKYFPTRIAPKAFPTQYAAVAPQAAAQFAGAAPTTIAPSVAPAAFQVTPGPIYAGSGLSQVHPVYAQSAISTTQMPQVAAQYVARPVAVGVVQPVPRPLYVTVPQPTPVAQQQYLQPTAVAPQQQQQYISTPQPVPQQYLQPVQQAQRPSPPRYQPAPSRYAERPSYQPSSTPGYETPEPTTYAPRPAPSRRPYYPRRPTSSYHRPAYRQQYRRPQARPQYNPSRRVTYYRAGTQQRVQQPYHKPQYNPQPSQQPQYASPNAYSRPSQYQSTTTEASAPGERYYARENNADQNKVAYAESPFDKMEFQSTPVPVGQKKDVKVTFINRQRMA